MIPNNPYEYIWHTVVTTTYADPVILTPTPGHEGGVVFIPKCEYCKSQQLFPFGATCNRCGAPL